MRKVSEMTKRLLLMSRNSISKLMETTSYFDENFNRLKKIELRLLHKRLGTVSVITVNKGS